MLRGSRRARRVLGLLLLVNVVIVVLYAGLFAIHTFVVVDLPRELTHMVNLNRESTLATWFAAALLTTVAVLSILSAAVSPDPKERRGWIVLALGVAYLAIDEVSLIHERLPMLFRLEGDFARHAWLIPAIPIVVIALLVMARFLRHLPAYMRPVLLLGPAVFAAGAVVIEGLTGFIGDGLGGPWWAKPLLPGQRRPRGESGVHRRDHRGGRHRRPPGPHRPVHAARARGLETDGTGIAGARGRSAAREPPVLVQVPVQAWTHCAATTIE